MGFPGGLGGGASLAWVGVAGGRVRVTPPSATNTAGATGTALRSGAILALSNPQNVAYWAALGSAFGALGVSEPDQIDYVIFFAGFMASSVLWCFVCAGAVSWLFGGRGELWRVWTYRLFALAFAWLAAGTAYETLKGLPAAG